MMMKPLFATALMAISLTAFSNNMSPEPARKGFELPTDIDGSRRDYQKQSRVSYAKPEQTTAVEAPEVDAPAAAAAPAAAKEPIIHTGAKTQRRSGGMRY